MVGLYHYVAKDFWNAANQFDLFIDRLREDDSYSISYDNLNIASAYQFRGSSRLQIGIGSGLEDFNHAASFLTPYDPAAHNLYALASLVAENKDYDNENIGISQALKSLQQALELDYKNKRASTLITILSKAAKQKSPIGSIRWQNSNIDMLEYISNMYSINSP